MNVPAVRASSMPWLAQSPAATPTTVSSSPEVLPVKSVGFEAPFPGADTMAGADAWGTRVLLHIMLTELMPPSSGASSMLWLHRAQQQPLRQ